MKRFHDSVATTLICAGALFAANSAKADIVEYQATGIINSIQFNYQSYPLPSQFGTVTVGDTLTIDFFIDTSVLPDYTNGVVSRYSTAVLMASATINGGTESIQQQQPTSNSGPNLNMFFNTASATLQQATAASGPTDCFCSATFFGFSSDGMGGGSAYLDSSRIEGEDNIIASTNLGVSNVNVTTVPTPASWMLFGSAILGGAIFRKGRRQSYV